MENLAENETNVAPKKTNIVRIGNKVIGGGNPILVQSMTTCPLKDVLKTQQQIKSLEALGCDIIRVAVTDMEDANAIPEVVSNINIPLVCDIHFDYRLAIAAIENGAAKIRINPGNIGGPENVAAVAKTALMRNCPIRVGVNGGSLEKSLVKTHGTGAQALCQSALSQVKLLEDFGFNNIVISVKSSSVKTTIQAYTMLSEKTNHPLHLGVTEAGTINSGLVKSSIALGTLLQKGIGDTIRVSLTGSKESEVIGAINILTALGLRKGPELISCPTCGRCKMDVAAVAKEVEQVLWASGANICVAVMGCDVNGPTEAKGAHLGVAGAIGGAVLFKNGKIIKKLTHNEISSTLTNAIGQLTIDN